MHLSCFSKCIKCLRTRKQDQILKIYEQSSKRSKEELDIVNILEKQRKNAHDIAMMKHKLKLKNNPIFDTIDQQGIIEYNNGFDV